MTVLHSVDFFPSGNASVAIEPRLPQADFPEHHHDFHEIVIVEHGTGIHVFNGQPYTITGGTVCFVRDHDRHLYEHTDNLCLTNVLYRSPCFRNRHSRARVSRVCLRYAAFRGCILQVPAMRRRRFSFPECLRCAL